MWTMTFLTYWECQKIPTDFRIFSEGWLNHQAVQDDNDLIILDLLLILFPYKAQQKQGLVISSPNSIFRPIRDPNNSMRKASIGRQIPWTQKFNIYIYRQIDRSHDIPYHVYSFLIFHFSPIHILLISPLQLEINRHFRCVK